ncbi:MAG: aminodeoxychorismate synthase, component I [Sulfobacillus thermosulfidooxidans]|nr:MAG: aminodeoxychorismate synthase, component I [Sulfobacillus thermosulfidooxidans]
MRNFLKNCDLLHTVPRQNKANPEAWQRHHKIACGINKGMSTTTLWIQIDFPATQQKSWIFQDPDAIVAAYQVSDVAACLNQLQAATQSGKWVAGYIAYDAAPGIDPQMVVQSSPSDVPLLLFGIFSQPPLVKDQDVLTTVPPAKWTPDEDAKTHAQKISRIHDAIREGLTYQTNYTFRLRSTLSESPFAYYQTLRMAQQASYSMYIETESLAVLSLSPELFFSFDHGHVVTRPMKGTAPRGRYRDEDQKMADDLRHSDKNRAENVMITDLLRNDLGRIAITGSVQTTALWDIEAYPTVWQMTSTVEADIPEYRGWIHVMQSLFPSGSITGAPKLSTMKLIATLESSPRGIYCGTLGYATPEGSATFNVAIRTIVVDTRTHHAEFGTGGGITWDSKASDEYEELLTKSQFLTHQPPRFDLLETMRLDDGVYWLLSHHMQRLLASAQFYGYATPLPEIYKALQAIADTHPQGSWKVRLTLALSGSISTTISPLVPILSPQKAAWASSPVDAHKPWLFHKTTDRTLYDHHHPPTSKVFDHLLWNEQGEVTEFTRGNLVIWRDGQLVTPARESGLLAGTFRAFLLEQGEIQEGRITRDDLRRCPRAWFINSLHGWIPIDLPILD